MGLARNAAGFTHEPRSASVEWYTPPEIFEALRVSFDLDPAAPEGGVPWVPAERHFSRQADGLAQPWEGRVWLNPPYDRELGRWLRKLAVHGDGLALVFARTDTAWFHAAASAATAICFVKGRLRFIPAAPRARRGTAGAPSLLIAYGVPCATALAESGLGWTCLAARGAVSHAGRSAAHGAERSDRCTS